MPAITQARKCTERTVDVVENVCIFKSNRREVAGPTARMENIPSSTGALSENSIRALRERVYFSAALQPFAEKLQRATSPLKLSRSSAGVRGENSTGACVFFATAPQLREYLKLRGHASRKFKPEHVESPCIFQQLCIQPQRLRSKSHPLRIT